jgi:hypothetical protein
MSYELSIGDYIILKDKNLFVSLHSQNEDIAKILKKYKALVTNIDSTGNVREIKVNGKIESVGIYSSEIKTCFDVIPRDNNIHNINDTEYGSFKIIITYTNGDTIEEEGITSISVKPKSVGYVYNRKKFGFMKYSGEVILELKELKQITVSTPASERVFHIENGIIIREHIMYDDNRTFKSFAI